MGFRNFFYRISRFIWGMSLADRPIIWNKLQEIAMSGDWYYSKYLNSRFKAQKKNNNPTSLDSRFKAQKKLVQSNLFGFKIQGSEKTSSIQPLWIQDSRFKAQKKLLQSHLLGLKIQDSRFRKNFFNPTSLDSRFKIQGSEKTSSIQPLFRFRIQDSRLRKNFFNPTSLDSRFKIQGSEKTSSIQPLWIQDSRFKAQKKLLQFHLCGFKIQDSRLKAFGFNKFFWILNLESYPIGFKNFLGILNLESWILPPRIQEVFLGSWILNPESYSIGFKNFWGSWILNLESYPLGFKKCFWDLESWILPPWIQEVFLGFWILNPTSLDSRSLLGILNLESDVLREGWDGNKIAKKTMQFLITQKCPKF